MVLYPILAFNSRVLRAELGITKEKLAALADIDRSYVGQIESEDRAVSIDIADKLAKAFDVPVARLFFDKDSNSIAS